MSTMNSKIEESGIVTMLKEGDQLGLKLNNTILNALYLLVLIQRFSAVKVRTGMSFEVINFIVNEAVKSLELDHRHDFYNQDVFNDLKVIQNDLVNFVIESGYCGKKYKA